MLASLIPFGSLANMLIRSGTSNPSPTNANPPINQPKIKPTEANKNAPKPKPDENQPPKAPPSPSPTPSTTSNAPTTVHSKYGDGTPVMEGQQPPRLGEAVPVENNGYPQTTIRWDKQNNRIYQAREFDANGNPVRDIDFTSPTYPSGSPRPDHLPPPHQHKYVLPSTGGTYQRIKKPIPFEY